MCKKKMDTEAISDEREFVLVLIFTFLIPTLVTLIQLILSLPIDFLGMCKVFISNIVTSILAYTGVVIIQSIVQTAKDKATLSRWTLRSFMVLVVCSILYAVYLTYDTMIDIGMTDGVGE